jgi:hypothetical protein
MFAPCLKFAAEIKLGLCSEWFHSNRAGKRGCGKSHLLNPCCAFHRPQHLNISFGSSHFRYWLGARGGVLEAEWLDLAFMNRAFCRSSYC